jgi:hypothetical protein
MNTIPAQLKELARSPELYTQSEKIGDEFDLHINQIGELDAEIRDVLSGYSKSSDFIKHIMERLEIDRGTADKITGEVNKEVFGSIKEQLQKMQSEAGEDGGIADEKITSKNQQDISDLERVGGFNIEPTPGQNGNGSAPTNLPGAEEMVESHDELIAGIENPTSMMTSNLISTKPSTTTPEENHTDIIVDHLLTGPVAAAEQKTVKPAEPVKSALIEPKKPAGPDPYKEAIE